MPAVLEMTQVAPMPGDPSKLEPSTSPRQIQILKNNYYGIEVINNVVYQGWEPGREYTKNIILKNVNVKTQKIKYKNPKSRFYTTLFPKPVVLSAGTSFSLPITFRPLEKVVYEDSIEFHTKDGSFEVPITAVLPQVDITVPEFLDFSMCAAKDSVETIFEVKNSGDLETKVEWEVGEPFTIDPPAAILKSQQIKKFKATFKPENASVFEADAVCKYGNELNLAKVTKLEGIGKYPHILISLPGRPATTLNKDNLEATVQFGGAPVGTTLQKYIELHNLAPVRAPFKVEHPTRLSRIDTVFDCPQKAGIVPPMGSIKLPLTYNPHTVDTTSIDYFHIVAIGNISKSVVKCQGVSKGPFVQLSSQTINFMQIDSGRIGTKTIDIVNNSDVDAQFQFMLDCEESVFKFEKLTGSVRANSTITVIIKFFPVHPINYYKRLACIVHNQGPLFLDLLGTCHSETVKPAVLLSKHLDRYRCHVERGLSTYPPEELNELIRNNKLEIDDAGAVMIPETEVEHPHNPQSIHSVHPMDEYFNDGFHCDVINFVPHVSLETNNIDFGNCQNIRTIENKVINITNHTKGKITVQWMGGHEKTFCVMPLSMDIPPLKSCAFQVTFKPNAPNQFYGSELECFAYYKSLRDFRLVEDTTHFPPWCLNLTCSGQTFLPNNETFLPRFTLDTSRLVFPAVNTKESAYRTLQMRNTGTTPIFFDVQKDPNNVYSVKPAKALMKGEMMTFIVKCTPAEVRTYKHNLMFRLNDNEKYNKELEVWGSAESPEVLLDTYGCLYFRETCIGTFSKQCYTIKNVSRIPLRFEWKFKFADKKLLSVTPDCGIIQPNENQTHAWSFTPTSKEKYVMKPSLIVWGQGFSSTSSGGKKKEFNVRAIGEGTIGDIKADQTYIEFGDVVVGSSACKTIVISNESTCSLHYELFIEQTMTGPYPEELTIDDRIALQLERTEGILPARSKHVIMATVKPVRRVQYQFSVSYKLVTPEATTSHPTATEPQHLCHVLTTGVFPVMAVTDARCYGSAIGISKKQLWSLFSLDNMNVCLDSDPSAEELRYSVATRHSHHRRPPVYTRAILDFNFSAAPVGSEPCIVNLMFENTGTVATDWAFLFPSDLQLELEYWAETGEFDEDELHEMKVMDNKLFSVEPQEGKLQPGECRTVTFTYRHNMTGTDRLPVLLKLARGREVLLNFIGVTVEAERNYIHFPSNKHLFTPVPVGEKSSPKQVYELYNGGAKTVKFTFDLAPLELLQQENFDQPVFECLTPFGEIPPGRSLAVEWRFSPIEAKTYMVDVPVIVDKGDTAIVTFTGVGYDKRIMGETMPMTDQSDLTGVPGVQSAIVPGQLVYLSQERLSFGNLPLFSRARRMVFVSNRSKENDASFEWHVTSQSDAQYLSISPVRGYLAPGESRMCRVVFVACGVPSFYDLDLVCEVTDEVENRAYKQRLQDWEEEKRRQTYEFTITENDLEADQRLPDVEIKERSASRLSSLETKRENSEGELTKYRTLPPIKVLSPDEEKEIAVQKMKKDSLLWEKPNSPKPFLLHLGLTARTHDVREFQINFPEEYRNFYIDRSLSEKMAPKIEKKQKQTVTTPDLITCSTAEADVVSGVLSNVLRGLLDDTYFHEAVRKVTNESIPYYAQIGQRPVTAPTPSRESTKVTGRSSPPKEDDGRVSSVSLPMSEAGSVVSGQRQSPPSSAGSQTSQKKGKGKNGRKTKTPPRYSRDEIQRIKLEERRLKEKQLLKKNPEFGNMAESVMENALLNIMTEALNEEFNITARPRFIALPKRTASAKSQK
ncbi:cilia- and flagella-associated protein 65-like [Mytilus californianus]|uniref:cilia- and flagella-associated protein 65-like n=1 Tax=Mytilus californianus TaxID=6549 RepID=UPI0022472F7D|nr:cilia- and flagella-associated protein 65-like [Mytilus californianus]